MLMHAAGLRQIREEWDTLREHDVIFLIRRRLWLAKYLGLSLVLRIQAPTEPYDGRVAELTVAEFPEKFGARLGICLNHLRDVRVLMDSCKASSAFAALSGSCNASADNSYCKYTNSTLLGEGNHRVAG